MTLPPISVALAVLLAASPHLLAAKPSPPRLTPISLAAAPDGSRLFVACRDGARVLVVDTASWEVTRTWLLAGQPSGLALSPDGARLAVTSPGPASRVWLLDTATGKTARTIAAGHTAMAPVFSADGSRLFVCNRFDDSLSVIDCASGKELRRLKARREPVAAALTPDGRRVLVANHLPDGPANAPRVAAVISVLDVETGQLAAEIQLPNGSGSLQDIQVSPDGRHAVVTHILSRFNLPTTQLDRGWINTNAKTIIDLGQLQVLTTVLLDTVDRGAANPWGVGWQAGSTNLAVALAGTHEVMVIDFATVLARYQELAARAPKPQPAYGALGATTVADIPNDLSFLVRMSRRVRLPEGDLGPRALAVLGTQAVTANYFSDTLTVVAMDNPQAPPKTVRLGPAPTMDPVRLGEMYFNDARICFQGWQSCASCHPGDGRVDAFNWDLLNDGMGNPKNNKSLLYSHRTPPAMSTGIRDSAEVAVRSGVKHILFTVQPEPVYQALDEYLKSLRPVPSPALDKGRLSAAARRGQKLFNSARAGCSDCHPAPLYTDLQAYRVGTGPADLDLDTPTLVELWRTAPYLHDGSAATLREVLTTRNPGDRHGITSRLAPGELEDLEIFLKSL